MVIESLNSLKITTNNKGLYVALITFKVKGAYGSLKHTQELPEYIIPEVDDVLKCLNNNLNDLNTSRVGSHETVRFGTVLNASTTTNKLLFAKIDWSKGFAVTITAKDAGFSGNSRGYRKIEVNLEEIKLPPKSSESLNTFTLIGRKSSIYKIFEVCKLLDL